MRWMPSWLRTYPRDAVVPDLVAGLVVTVLLVPQGLAYAMLAGLPPVIGLYASVLPLLAYALLGSSMTLSVGPVAITALMTASALAPLAVAGSDEYVLLAAVLALMVGVLLLAAGLLRLGAMAQFLSRPVIHGFITGAALLILVNQLAPLLGLDTVSGSVLAQLRALPPALAGVVPAAATLGLVTLILLVLSRTLLPRLLRLLGMGQGAAALLGRLVPMLLVLLGIGLVALLDLEAAGVPVVGPMSAQWPGLSAPWPGSDKLGALFLPALMIALICFVESVAVAQALALRRRERIDANAELRGLGAANLFSGLSGAFAVAGGFSRSVVNADAGARTPMASVVAALAMLLVLWLLTGLFALLPKAVLAASIIVAVVGLIDLEALRQAWRYDRSDALAYLGTAAGVLVLGVEWGIALGVGWSLAALVWRSSHPHIAVIGRIPGTQHFRNSDRHNVESLPGTLALRIDENLFFGNVQAVEDFVRAAIERNPSVSEVLLVMSSVSQVDVTAMETLQELNRELIERGLRLHLAEVKGPVLDRLNHSALMEELSGEIFLSTHQAFEALEALAREGSDTPSI